MKSYIFYLGILIYVLYECEGFASKELLCGERLAETLSYICQGEYAERNKKSQNYPALDFYKLSSSNEIDNYYKSRYPFALKSSQYQFFNHRVKRGIVDECCTEKTCGYEDLTRYCRL